VLRGRLPLSGHVSLLLKLGSAASAGVSGKGPASGSSASGPRAAATAGERAGAGEPYSSGIPALRSPAKKVISNKARASGTPKYMAAAFSRAMLE
jgi:hypothetical protein